MALINWMIWLILWCCNVIKNWIELKQQHFLDCWAIWTLHRIPIIHNFYSFINVINWRAANPQVMAWNYDVSRAVMGSNYSPDIHELRCKLNLQCWFGLFSHTHSIKDCLFDHLVVNSSPKILAHWCTNGYWHSF